MFDTLSRKKCVNKYVSVTLMCIMDMVNLVAMDCHWICRESSSTVISSHMIESSALYGLFGGFVDPCPLL